MPSRLNLEHGPRFGCSRRGINSGPGRSVEGGPRRDQRTVGLRPVGGASGKRAQDRVAGAVRVDLEDGAEIGRAAPVGQAVEGRPGHERLAKGGILPIGGAPGEAVKQRRGQALRDGAHRHGRPRRIAVRTISNTPPRTARRRTRADEPSPGERLPSSSRAPSRPLRPTRSTGSRGASSIQDVRVRARGATSYRGEQGRARRHPSRRRSARIRNSSHGKQSARAAPATRSSSGSTRLASPLKGRNWQAMASSCGALRSEPVLDALERAGSTNERPRHER